MGVAEVASLAASYASYASYSSYATLLVLLRHTAARRGWRLSRCQLRALRHRECWWWWQWGGEVCV